MKVQLLTNPATDRVFRLKAERMLGDAAASPDDLQSNLRRDYPRAAVVRGIEDNGAERWYAYRDGHWIGRD